MKYPLFLILFYAAIFMALTISTGHLSLLGEKESLFAEYDSYGYTVVSDFLTGRMKFNEDVDYYLKLRPFLFPVYLSLHKYIGIFCFQSLQIAMNFGAVVLTYSSVFAACRRKAPAAIAAVLFCITPTFTFLPFQAMAETLALFGVSLFVFLVVKAVAGGVLPLHLAAAGVLALLVCVKPVFLPFFIIYFLFAASILFYRKPRLGLWLPLTLLPLVVQLALTRHYVGKFSVSNAGRQNFDARFFPAVYGFKEYRKFAVYNSKEAQEGVRKYPAHRDKLDYVLRNPMSALRASVYILIREHLASRTANLRSAPPNLVKQHARAITWIERFSLRLNMLFLAVHVLMIFFLAYVAIQCRQCRSVRVSLLLYAFALTIVLTAPLTYFQGDRIAIVAEPVWLVVYGIILGRPFKRDEMSADGITR